MPTATRTASWVEDWRHTPQIRSIGYSPFPLGNAPLTEPLADFQPLFAPLGLGHVVRLLCLCRLNAATEHVRAQCNEFGLSWKLFMSQNPYE